MGRPAKNLAQVSMFLNTRLNAVWLLLQALGFWALGILLILKSQLLVEWVTLSVQLLLILLFLLSAGRFFSSVRKKQRALILGNLLRALISAALVAVLWIFHSRFWVLFPLLMGLYSLLISFTHGLTFFQYAKERLPDNLVNFISALVHFVFGIIFIISMFSQNSPSFTVVGIYFLLYGATVFMDFLSDVIPSRKKARLKLHLRLALPAFLTTFLPLRAYTSIQRYLNKNGDTDLNASREGAAEPNVEVLIHVSGDPIGQFGHMDLCVEGKLITYGLYDESKRTLFNTKGPGVLVEHTEKDNYIQFLHRSAGTIVFGFGLCLSPEELGRLSHKLTELHSRAYEWICDAALADQGKIPQGEFTDYGSRIYRATGAKFYKFRKGSFKHYFALGVNCVKMADTLLMASGADTVVSGIVSPGTYFAYLNREFMRTGGRVVRRTVYKQIPESEQQKELSS